MRRPSLCVFALFIVTACKPSASEETNAAKNAKAQQNSGTASGAQSAENAGAPTPSPTNKASATEEIAGGIFLILSCDVANASQPAATKTVLGCSVKNNDGSQYVGTYDGISAQVYGRNKPVPVKGTVATGTTAYQISIVVDQLAPGDATTVVINGNFNGKMERLSAAVSRELTFTVGPMDFYVDSSAAAAHLLCTKDAPCSSINQALALVPQAIYHAVNIHIVAGDYNEQVVVISKTMGGLSHGDGNLALIGERKGFVEDPAVDCTSGAGPSCFHVLTPSSGYEGILVSGLLNQGNSDTPFTIRNAVVTGSSQTSSYGLGIYVGNGSMAYLKNIRVENTLNDGIQVDTNSAVALEDISIVNAAYAGLRACRTSTIDLGGTIAIEVDDQSRNGIVASQSSGIDFDPLIQTKVDISFPNPADPQAAGSAITLDRNSSVLVNAVDKKPMTATTQSSLIVHNAPTAITLNTSSSFSATVGSITLLDVGNGAWVTGGGQLNISDSDSPTDLSQFFDLTVTTKTGPLFYASGSGSNINIDSKVKMSLCEHLDKTAAASANYVAQAVLGAVISVALSDGIGTGMYDTTACSDAEIAAAHKLQVGPGAQIIIGDPTLAGSAKKTGDNFLYP